MRIKKERKKRKFERVELPVSLKPEVRSYSYYAFPQCIIMAEERIGKRIAKFEICGSSETGDWTSIGLKKEDSCWVYDTEDAYNRACNGCIYRPLAGNEGYIHVKMHFQQESEPWAAINLFLTEDEENVLLGDEKYLCRFGNFIHDGVSLYFEGKKEEIPGKDDGREGEFVLNISQGRIECFYGEGKNVKKVGERQLKTGKQLYIGVQVRHEENSFYPWLFSNFIQISCDVGSMHRRLEFYNFYKDEQFDLPNHFLNYNYIQVQDLMQRGGISAIKWELCQKRYVEMKLDQYYLDGRDEYHYEHHLHQNLLYGFDDKQKIFLAVGYDNLGKIQKYHISYEDMKETLKRYEHIVIKSITYHQGFRFYRFVPEYIKKVCKDYLEGINTELATQPFLPTEDRVYGIRIYEELQTQKGLEVLVSDRRVSYVLYEHKVIMEKRIEYMWQEELIDKELYDTLKETAHLLVTTAFNLIHVCQKYRLRPDKRKDILLVDLLMNLKKEDEILMKYLTQEWKRG